MYAACTLHTLYMYPACFFCMYSSCIFAYNLHVLYMYYACCFACILHEDMKFACALHLVCICFARILHVLCTCFASMLYLFWMYNNYFACTLHLFLQSSTIVILFCMIFCTYFAGTFNVLCMHLACTLQRLYVRCMHFLHMLSMHFTCIVYCACIVCVNFA